MAKSKHIAEDLQEEKLSLEKPLGQLEPSLKAPRVIQMKGLTNEVYKQLIDYLETRPHGEVKALVQSLSQAAVLDVTE